MAKSVTHRAPRKRGSKRIIAVVVAAVVALLVVGSAYAIATRDDTTSSTPSGGAGTEGSSPSAGDTPSAEPSDDTGSDTGDDTGTSDDASLAACAAHVSKAEAAVAAARTGVRDWRTHVQARTDMYAGRISVQRMDALWKRSRLAGPADQEHFKTALTSYEETSPCGDLAAVPQTDAEAARACVTRARVATKAVDAARAAMADWKSHLDHMASYAHGEMTADMAQTMWVEAWRNAPPHITAYQRAREALAEAPSCTDAS